MGFEFFVFVFFFRLHKLIMNAYQTHIALNWFCSDRFVITTQEIIDALLHNGFRLGQSRCHLRHIYITQ